MIAQEVLERHAARPRNLVEIFEATAARAGSRAATKQKQGGRWIDTSWAEMARRARRIADGLASLGVKKGDRVAIIGETRTEWILADLGILGAGAVTVPIYHSNRPLECAYVLEDSGARFVFCDDAQVTKIGEVRDRLPGLEGIIRLDGRPESHGASGGIPGAAPGGGGEAGGQSPAAGFERTLADLEEAGAAFRATDEQAHARRIASLTLDEPACFIYTSGTTGNPKGVVLTHGNFLYEADAIASIDILTSRDLVLTFLPMAHVFAKTIEAVWFKVAATVAFVESVDKLVDNAAEVRPTVMPAVPRIFEKAYNAVVSKGLATPGVKGRLFKWAMQSLDAYAEASERGSQNVSLGLLVGRKLVFPKVGQSLSERFGGRLRLFVSGAAPLSPKIAWFFRTIGIEILEGYGLTESTAATFVNRPGKAKIGTVGPPVPGTDVRIAEDGEILVRGPGVMKGYHERPEDTAEALKDGWLHTGDIGTVDADGYLKITDRKKDIIVTAGGKNVAPQNLEGQLKTDPLISHVMVHGDKRKFLSALVTLSEENVRKWAAENGVRLSTPLHQDHRVHERLQATFDALNSRQASYSSIRKFAILPRDFTQESGELTPTLKVKRKFCTQKYQAVLDSFYRE